MRIRIIALDGRSKEVVLGGSIVRFGRDLHCEVPFDSLHYPMVSGCHASIEMGAAGPILIPRSATNMTLLNGQRVSAPTAIKIGDRIALAAIGPAIEIIDLDFSDSKPVSTSPEPMPTSLPPEPMPAPTIREPKPPLRRP